MNRFLAALVTIANIALDAIMWLHDRVMLYVVLVFLVPLLVSVTISLLIYDVRPWVRGVAGSLFYVALFGLPFWLVLCGVLERSMTATAARVTYVMQRTPIYVGIALFAVGGLLWLLG